MTQFEGKDDVDEESKTLMGDHPSRPSEDTISLQSQYLEREKWTLPTTQAFEGSYLKSGHIYSPVREYHISKFYYTCIKCYSYLCASDTPRHVTPLILEM